MKKIYTSAPLPFQGQKRRFLKDFKVLVEQLPSSTVYVDLFGGSGLLSHAVKTIHPDAKVIYNDYDNFSKRLKAIPVTNNILKDIRIILKDVPRETRVPVKLKCKILERIKKESEFVDYITLSSSIGFSMAYCLTFEQLQKQTFYNNVKVNDYNSNEYLTGLDVVKEDYKSLFSIYKNHKKVVFILDPPYLSTNVSTYKNYWRLSDYLNVLELLHNQSYFYFTSSKSNLVELCEWFEKSGWKNPFKEALKTEIVINGNKIKYTDIMLFKLFDKKILK